MRAFLKTKTLCLAVALLSMAVTSVSAQMPMRTDLMAQNLICADPRTVYPDASLSESQQDAVSSQSVDTRLAGVSVNVLGERYASLGLASDIGVVDWVQIDLRAIDSNDPNANAAAVAGNENLTVARAAGLLLSSGQVVNPEQEAGAAVIDGLTIDQPDNLDMATQDVYVVVNHRNHLSIMSAENINDAIGDAGPVIDFTTSADQTYNGASAVKEVMTGVFAMRSGDADSSGVADFTSDIIGANGWINVANERNVYTGGDINMNGIADFTADIVGARGWLGNANARGTVTIDLGLGDALTDVTIPPTTEADLPCYVSSPA